MAADCSIGLFVEILLVYVVARFSPLSTDLDQICRECPSCAPALYCRFD